MASAGAYGSQAKFSPPPEEEANNLSRSTKKVKMGELGGASDRPPVVVDKAQFDQRRKSSYRHMVMGLDRVVMMEGTEKDMFDDASDEGEVDEDDEGPWISLGMSKEEKIHARKPWRLSLIIKLVGRRIGYQFLLCRLQAMWKPKYTFNLIDLCNDYFIARFSNQTDYEFALLSGPWIISDHYLHVQRWIPNFMPDTPF